jgi:CopG family nickel-responsive transcriptional regulator
MAVTRFSVSLEADQLKALDGFVDDNLFANRSQAIRALIEKNIVEQKWQCNNHVAGALILVYDSDKNDVAVQLLAMQQKHAAQILSTQRFFRENHLCLEIIAVEGTAQQLTRLSDDMIGRKGVIHGKLIMSRIR